MATGIAIGLGLGAAVVVGILAYIALNAGPK